MSEPVRIMKLATVFSAALLLAGCNGPPTEIVRVCEGGQYYLERDAAGNFRMRDFSNWFNRAVSADHVDDVCRPAYPHAATP